MANTLRIKRRSGAGAAGAPTTLENAELAYNEADDVLYYGKGTGGIGGAATTVEAIAGFGAYTSLGTTQTITGNKTFSGTIIVPVPTANTHASTKKYVDDLVTGINSNISAVATSFTVSGNTGTSQTITSGVDTLSIVGGTGLTSAASATDTITLNLVNTAVSAGSYGSASSIGTFTVDAQGRLTVAGNTTIAITASQVSDFNEAAQDAVDSAITAGTGISKSYNDGSNTLTITNSGVVSLAGTANEIAVSASNGAITLSLPSNVTIPNNLVVTGDLTVQGNTTTLNTATLVVEDKNIILSNVASPTDITADGAGITILGTTNKTLSWVDATDAWTSSEHLDLAAGKVFKIGTVEILSSTTLGTSVVNSSLTSLGTIVTGVWNGSTIGIGYGGTGATTASGARTSLELGTIAIQNANSVSITGGSITNLTTFDGINIDGGTF